MSYEIQLSEMAFRNLDSLEPAVAESIISKLEEIKDAPLENSKRLAGVNLHSLKVGDYRLVLKIDNVAMRVFVTRISNRREKYAKLDTI